MITCINGKMVETMVNTKDGVVASVNGHYETVDGLVGIPVARHNEKFLRMAIGCCQVNGYFCVIRTVITGDFLEQSLHSTGSDVVWPMASMFKTALDEI